MRSEAIIWFGCIWVMNCPCVPPLWLMAEEPAAEEPAVEAEPMDEEPDVPGCIAGEPRVDEPEPEAAGRSVGAEGAGEV
jgi:hypothetical protein